MKRIYLIMAVIVAAMMMSCVPEVEKATVETREVADITSNSVRVICNVSDDGGAEVSSRGVCWDTLYNPIIETALSMDAGSGIGNYECEIDGLNSNTTYYVRAYATNSAGVSYGEEMNFNTLSGDEDNEDNEGNEGNENGDDNGEGDDNNNDNGNNDDNDGDNYDPDGEIVGHGYVDLGLPSGLKWATCNVGADKPEDYGDYFAWGEIIPKSSYTEETYIHWNDVNGDGWWDVNAGELTIISDFSGNAQYDAATANWGGSWRMPTKEEMQELVDNCIRRVWVVHNGVEGFKVTGPNGNSIFLPAAGWRTGVSLQDDVYDAFYWVSTMHEYNDNLAYLFHFFNGYDDEAVYSSRYLGFSVRPVSE